jgi:hypothetical protein
LARTAAAAAAVVALAAVACGGSDDGSDAGPRPVDTEEVESLLVATQRRTSPDFNVGAAECPEQVTVSEGATFNCTVMVEGVAAPYIVTFADVNARNQTGRYDLRPAKAILSVPKLVELVKSLAADPGARVDCGPARVLVADVGATLQCRLSDTEGGHTVNLRVDDIEGRVTVTGTT